MQVWSARRHASKIVVSAPQVVRLQVSRERGPFVHGCTDVTRHSGPVRYEREAMVDPDDQGAPANSAPDCGSPDIGDDDIPF